MHRFLIFFMFIFSTYSYSKCAMPRQYVGSFIKLMSEFDNIDELNTNKPQKKAILDLIEYAINVKNKSNDKLRFPVDRHYRKSVVKPFRMELKNFKRSMIDLLSVKADWKLAKNYQASSKLSSDKETYLSTIKDSPYLSAWYFLAIKDNQRAIASLKKGFNSEYEIAVKVRQTQNSLCGNRPQFYWFKQYYHALEALLPESDFSEIKAKYDKAQRHISSVPRVRMLT